MKGIENNQLVPSPAGGRAVASLKLPVSIRSLVEFVEVLNDQYGRNLVMSVLEGGWLEFRVPTNQEK